MPFLHTKHDGREVDGIWLLCSNPAFKFEQMPARDVIHLAICLTSLWVYSSCCVCVLAEYLVGSNEGVHSQVVLHHLLCGVRWEGLHSALEQSRWAWLARLARRAGGLDVPEESVPGLAGGRGEQIRHPCNNTSASHCRCIYGCKGNLDSDLIPDFSGRALQFNKKAAYFT